MIYVMLLQKKTNKMDYTQKTKKLVSILIVFLFFSQIGFAQKTISETEFNHLVDYANCFYLKTYIEKKGESNFSDEIRLYIEKASLDEYDNISYETLIGLLFNQNSARNLAGKINNRKVNFKNYSDDKSLLQSLSTTGWDGVDLTNTANTILSNIQTKLNEKSTSIIGDSQIENPKEVPQTQPAPKGVNEDTDASFLDKSLIDKNTSMVIYVLLVLNLLAFTVLVLKIRNLSKNKSNINSDEIYQKVINDDRILNLLKSKVPINSVDPTNRFQLILDDISKRLLKTESSLIQLEKLVGQKPNELPKNTDKFLKGKSGNVFSRVESSSEGCFYKLINEKNETAEFEFCANIEDVRHQTNAVFDNVSELSGSIQNAKSIQTAEKGKVKLVNGKWEVTQKTKIKFI